MCRSTSMCDFGAHRHQHEHEHYGFLVDTPDIRALIHETERLARDIADIPARLDALKPAFSALLSAEGWLPDAFAQPDLTSAMGGGIGQYALYRAADGSLCLFSLVIPPGAETPVHDHLAWGLIGVYRGRQDETVYRRLDNGADESHATLEVARRQTVATGEFYGLIPPLDDIHYVKTVSDVPSISIHLLANDTACVWRHRFDPAAGTVTAFRSGYSNAPCPEGGHRDPEAQRSL
jgi:predicted metal-dependent enzyme (double-stranded beta helix superfamily)